MRFHCFWRSMSKQQRTAVPRAPSYRGWSLAFGQHYIQDEPLDWGCAVERITESLTRLRAASVRPRGWFESSTWMICSCQDLLAMPLIRNMVITADREGRVHIAPIGLIAEDGDWIIAPFRPSTTLDNLVSVPFATANHTDDVRVSRAVSPASTFGPRWRPRRCRCHASRMRCRMPNLRSLTLKTIRSGPDCAVGLYVSIPICHFKASIAPRLQCSKPRSW